MNSTHPDPESSPTQSRESRAPQAQLQKTVANEGMGAQSDDSTKSSHEQASDRKIELLLESQEQKLAWLAYELHDGLIQDLVAAKMLLELQKSHSQVETKHEKIDLSTASNSGLAKNPFEADDPIEQAIELLRKSINEGRRIIEQLRPLSLDHLGLEAAIRELIEAQQHRDGVQIRFTFAPAAHSLRGIQANMVWRIVQESLNNSIRHGHAGTVFISLSSTQTDSSKEKDQTACTSTGVAGTVEPSAPKEFILSIIDDGIGFDVNQSKPGKFGLEGIRRRAEICGGNATFESHSGEGTQIIVRFPENFP
jgi:two-component system, NarL family, sensor histidine kinase DegS